VVPSTPSTVSAPSPPRDPSIPPDALATVVSKLVQEHGASRRGAIERGVRQVAERWWAEDGDASEFARFCESHYRSDEPGRTALRRRLEEALEQVDGHLLEIRRELRRPIDLDTGPLTEMDLLLADVDVSGHVDQDLFRTRVAFLALLHFPVHTLAERLAEGPRWSREEWARSRMMDRFAERIPPPVHQAATRAMNAADRYIAEYNIRLDRVVTSAGGTLFPEGLRVISHWGLRDTLRSCYADGPAGLPKQRAIQRIMERIVRQEIPEAVRDNPALLWCPETNDVRPAGEGSGAPAARGASEREPDTRYARLLDVFHAMRVADPFCPDAPTFLQRRFEREREIPEAEVEALFETILTSPEVRDLARRIGARIGRRLEPFDIWYPGFSSRGAHPEAELDAAVRTRYPTRDALQAGLPGVLERLGFSQERARWLSDRIVIDAARGSGHALPAHRREDKVHLRTRIAGGMSYQSFNITMHELGHNVEEVFSLFGIDHWFLSGVPNVAFTEAMAFVFQSRDVEILGFAPDPDARRHRALHTLWMAYEMCGVSLIDMRLWRWMYEHPDATPAALRQSVIAMAREVWNRYYADVFGSRDVELLSIYSHIVNSALYLPDYAIGQVVAFQVAPRLEGGAFAAEVERMTRLGCLTPDAWMRAAVGAPLSSRPLLQAAREALDALPD
jgi:hypothetical protein